MVTVQGGTLPTGSELAGQTVSTFEIGKYEVTWGEWKAVRAWAVANGYTDLANVGSGSGDDHPVREVSWYDVVKWCNARSEKEGKTAVYQVGGAVYRSGEYGNNGSWVVTQKVVANGYRLPLEKEWEFAARGGVKSNNYTFSGANNIEEVAWYLGNSNSTSAPVGAKKPNELEIYDMSGNVEEWCWDTGSYGNDKRVKGGNYLDPAERCDFESGHGGGPDYRFGHFGFRYVRNAIGDMVTVQGGTLPAGSGLAGQVVQTFDIGRFEVTWEEWQAVRTYGIANGYDLNGVGNGTDSTHPVQSITWYDVVKWCNAKSQMEGLTPVYTLNGIIYKIGQSDPMQSSTANGYRLPTEKEWEWAARGGVSSKGYTYSGGNDINLVGWYVSNSSGATKNVGTKASNELGIYDMSGNVTEWCWDAYGTSRWFRGGSLVFTGTYCAVNNRSYVAGPSTRYNDLGFRLARKGQ
jgi:formylglycine-generating enzyme required for sulfatase activity